MQRLLALSLLTLCSCSKLIGLDDFKYDVGAAGGSAGDGGSAASAGANAGAQNGGAGDAGGTSGAGGPAGMGGSAGMGGAPGGAAGAGGTDATGGVSGTGGSSGMTGAGGTGGTGPTCDTTKDPRYEPCLVDEAYGIFVSGDGDDTTGDGTRAAPYGSINRGLDAAAIAGKNVYA
ncbi:MAG: hypothetical protein AB7K71_27145, partial [Polyangiaceae bacterium]